MFTYDDPFSDILLQENTTPATCDVVSMCLSAEEVDLSLLEARETRNTELTQICGGDKLARHVSIVKD